MEYKCYVLGLGVVGGFLASSWSDYRNSRMRVSNFERAKILGVSPKLDGLMEDERKYILIQVGTEVLSRTRKIWTVPFKIETEGEAVEVNLPLTAQGLRLENIAETTHNKLTKVSEDANSQIIGSIDTEEVLQNGALVTALGEVALINKQYKIGPSSSLHRPFILVNGTVRDISEIVHSSLEASRAKLLVFTALALIILGLLVRKIWKNWKAESDPPQTVEEFLLCVVCKEKQKQIILFPCGHLCLCSNCSENISFLCPICRSVIEYRANAFIP